MSFVEEEFRNSTLADVLADPSPSVPLGSLTDSAE